MNILNYNKKEKNRNDFYTPNLISSTYAKMV